MKIKVCAITLLLAHASAAQELVIQSFERDGTIVFTEIPSQTGYQVEMTTGSDWTGIDSVPASGIGSIEATVSMVDLWALYRVSYAVTNSPELLDMVLVPSGRFSMGDEFNDPLGTSLERPVHTVQVSAFYMDQYEVTKALWDEVATWAAANGYDISAADGIGKAAEHPVQTVAWPTCVKWCNARSEMAGLIPAYYTSAARTEVYRTGVVDVQNDWVRWESGYRLPTEAEWEWAARGGSSAERFPWGSEIDHGRANYTAFGSMFSYDTSPYTSPTPHPRWDDGPQPYTAPVGSFDANAYGLHDMAGNILEWCWDYLALYEATPVTDPRGPETGVNRMLRGGSWMNLANLCRVTGRHWATPDLEHTNIWMGFRTVLQASE